MGTGAWKVEGRANRVRWSQSQGFVSFNTLGWLCLSFLLLSILFFLFLLLLHLRACLFAFLVNYDTHKGKNALYRKCAVR